MKTSEQIIQAVAIGMRQAYGEYMEDPVIPWEQADPEKQKAWLQIAEAGIEIYERETAP